jgi:hypothetical protein
MVSGMVLDSLRGEKVNTGVSHPSLREHVLYVHQVLPGLRIEWIKPENNLEGFHGILKPPLFRIDGSQVVLQNRITQPDVCRCFELLLGIL